MLSGLLTVPVWEGKTRSSEMLACRSTSRRAGAHLATQATPSAAAGTYQHRATFFALGPRKAALSVVPLHQDVAIAIIGMFPKLNIAPFQSNQLAFPQAGPQRSEKNGCHSGQTSLTAPRNFSASSRVIALAWRAGFSLLANLLNQAECDRRSTT